MKQYLENEFPNLISELATLLEPHTYAEIGVQNGYTFNRVSPFFKRAIAVDIAPMPKVERRDNVKVYQMSSLDFAKQCDEKIDFMLIDADHHSEAVLADFDALSPLVTEGTGLIFLHDTHPMTDILAGPGYCRDAWRAAEEIRFSDKYRPYFEIMTLPGPWAGLSIVRKSKKQVAWM
jgi:hypothetical protein